MSDQRYARQISLPEIGPEGQASLVGASVLLAGVGGLGSPAALYLAAAGVGRLILTDPDTVALSNLQRQILYASAEVGQAKAERAQARLQALNPEIRVEAHRFAIDPGNARDLIADADLVLDGSDNLSTRYLLNDACVMLAKPLVHGSVYRFEGQVASFVPGGPCYRCLYPELPPAGAMPNCAEAGVLGVLPGLVGVLQASEALRLLLGAGAWGEGLSGRLLLADLRRMDFTTLGIPKNPACPACGEGARITELVPAAYPELACLAAELDPAAARILLDRQAVELLDVRSQAEHQSGNLGGRLIPLELLIDQAHTLNPEQPLLVYCQKGQRSARAVSMLKDLGFTDVHSLKGGYDAWRAASQGETA